MRVLICDDEARWAESIAGAIERWMADRAVANIAVDAFHSSEDMLEALQKRDVYDLAFLDIQFPGEMNGLQAARELRAANDQLNIVFVSNYEEYAVDGYRVNALRFIFKPFSDAQIFECLDIAYNQWKLAGESCVLLGGRQEAIRLAYKSMDYIESRAHYLCIHQVSRDKADVQIRMKLTELFDKLPGEMFVRCHQSYVVNLLYVQQITRANVILLDGTEIPVSAKYHADVITRFVTFYQGEKT